MTSEQTRNKIGIELIDIAKQGVRDGDLDLVKKVIDGLGCPEVIENNQRALYNGPRGVIGQGPRVSVFTLLQRRYKDWKRLHS